MSVFGKCFKFSLIILLLSACVKNDYSNFSDDYSWTPVVSIPLYNTQMLEDEYAGRRTFENDYVYRGEVDLCDTLDFDLEEIVEEQEYIESYMLRLNIRNGFPAKLRLYAVYLNSDYLAIATAVEDTLQLDSAKVDNTGALTEIPLFIHDEYVDEAKMAELTNVKYLLVKAKLTETNQSPEVIANLSNYYIDLKMGIRMNINYPINQ